MMRDKHVRNKSDKEHKLREEKEALYRVQREIDRQEALKMRSSDILKNEFLFFNTQKQLGNKLRRGHEAEVKAQEKYEHFPFVSGDVIDQHRKGLNLELRTDLQNYMMAKEKTSPEATPGSMRNS